MEPIRLCGDRRRAPSNAAAALRGAFPLAAAVPLS